MVKFLSTLSNKESGTNCSRGDEQKNEFIVYYMNQFQAINFGSFINLEEETL
jgi:hypothetical protein